jgi:predicted dehydrogenase
MDIRAAIIGCGAIAEEHLKALAEVGGIEAVAYCDVDLDRADRLCAMYGGDYATTEVDRVLDDAAIDLVYICTHHDTHAPIAIRACEAGKHIMMEKPVALTIEEIDDVAEAIARSGVTFMSAFKLRYYPMVERARRFIPNPLMAVAQVMDERWPDDFWATDPVRGGGNLLSQGVHAMDLLCHLNGSEPELIYAEGGAFTHDGGVNPDSLVATIRFANGRVASLAQADAGSTPLVSKFSFQLVDGVRSVHLHDRLRSGLFFDGRSAETIIDERELGMIEENRALLNALRTSTPPPTGIADGRRATLMVLRAFEAIRTGLPQRL